MVSVRLDLPTNDFVACLSNHRDEGNLVSEGLNLLRGDVLEHGALAARLANPATRIDTIGKQALEGLSR
jgi:hypothetical protein